MSPSQQKQLLALFSCATALGLTACGGGSSGTSTATATPSPSPAPAAATTIAGSAVKGPVANATVTFKSGSTGATLATGTTDSNGAYSISVPVSSGDVIVEVTGGTYIDEATGASTTLSTPLRNVVTANGGTVQGFVTPLTTLAYTYAFGTATTGVTASAYAAKATSVARQFQVADLNALPVVSGSMNTYGQVLRGLSQYLANNSVTLTSFTTTAMSSAQWTSFTSLYNAAYQKANPGSNVTFNFTGTGLSVSGTGAGGGTGTCGVSVTGSISTQGITVPLNLNYCVTGIAAGSCSSGNSSLSQSLAGQSGLVGAANLQYTYSASCAAAAFTFELK